MYFRRESSVEMYILAGFISFAAIILVFVAYFSAKAINEYYSAHRPPKEHSEIIYSKDYYDNLAKECLKKESQDCCLSSVQTMRMGNYGILTKEECPENFVKNNMSCPGSYIWCQPLAGSDFKLDFFSGGSIFSNNINIKIADGYINYKQSTYEGNKEIESINRPISLAEMDSLRDIIGSSDLISLKSQNFRITPLIPGQAYYEIYVSMDKKDNKIKCGMPISTASPDLECQKRIESLRTKLGNMLSINIK